MWIFLAESFRWKDEHPATATASIPWKPVPTVLVIVDLVCRISVEALEDLHDSMQALAASEVRSGRRRSGVAIGCSWRVCSAE